MIIGNLKFEAHFGVLYQLYMVESQNIEGASMFVLSYHWLSLATIGLVGDNREFEV